MLIMENQWRWKEIKEDCFLICSERWGARAVNMANFKSQYLLHNNCLFKKGVGDTWTQSKVSRYKIHETISHRQTVETPKVRALGLCIFCS